jgi:hypothetical protein
MAKQLIQSVTPQAVEFSNKAGKILLPLWERWQDESKYENIADYAAPLQATATACDVTIEKMTARPFGCVFTVPHPTGIRRFTLTCKRNGNYLNVAYKRIG